MGNIFVKHHAGNRSPSSHAPATQPASRARTSRLLQLPVELQHHIVLLLADPGPLAATCHANAAMLSEDALLLKWAKAHAPPTPPASKGAHMLLYWRRLHHMPLVRTIQLLCPGATELKALQQRLPHSQHLLLGHAAAAGNVQLVQAMLQMGAPARSIKMAADAGQVYHTVLETAVLCAARAGQPAALPLLLAQLHARDAGTCRQVLHGALLAAALSGKAACMPFVLQQLQPEDCSTYVTAAAQAGSASCLAALLEYSQHCAAQLAVELAASPGQLQLMGMVQPADTCPLQAAIALCAAGPSCIRRPNKAGWVEAQELLPAAMLQLLEGVDPCKWVPLLEQHWLPLLCAVLEEDAASVLASMWSVCSEPLVRCHLYLCCLHALDTANSLGHTTSTFLLQCWGTSLQSVSMAQERGARRKALLRLLRLGHIALLELAQHPDTTTQLILESSAWGHAAARGSLLAAVHRGDVRAAVSLACAHPDRCMEALLTAARLPDAAAAAAMCAALAPYAGDLSRPPSTLLAAHSGKLLQPLTSSPSFRAAAVGADACHWLRDLLQQGDAAPCLGLLSLPQQSPELLQDAAAYALTFGAAELEGARPTVTAVLEHLVACGSTAQQLSWYMLVKACKSGDLEHLHAVLDSVVLHGGSG